jgi:AcrR family transcriptional regulator
MPHFRERRTRSARAESLVSERGHAAVSITDIADRASVAVTSLYRRWGDVRVLTMEVATEQ